MTTKWVYWHSPAAAARRIVLLALIAMPIAAPIFGQAAPPAYDVVTIQPNKSGPGRMRIGNVADGFSGTNASLKMMIQIAFNLDSMDQIVGMPGWANSAGYDVQAKIDPDVMDTLKKLPKKEADEQRRLMLRNLLADRFQLKQHAETRELQTYTLTVAKGGTKLKDTNPDDPNAIKGPDGVAHPGMMMIQNGTLTAQAIPMSNLARMLTSLLHRQVVDKTLLTGKYDVSLKFTAGNAPANPDAADAPPLITAVQEQLGLKLDSVKGPVSIVVVDSVAQPVVE